MGRGAPRKDEAGAARVLQQKALGGRQREQSNKHPHPQVWLRSWDALFTGVWCAACFARARTSIRYPHVGLLFCSHNIEGASAPSKQGIVRKRGRFNTAFRERYFALVNGTIYYYDSERAYYQGVRSKGKLNVQGAIIRASTGFNLKVGFEWTVLEGESERELACACGSEESREDWLDAIEREGGVIADGEYEGDDGDEA